MKENDINDERLNVEKDAFSEHLENFDSFQDVEILHTSKIYKVRNTMMNAQLEAFGKIMKHRIQDEEDISKAVTSDRKIACKVAAICTLPGLFKLKRLYWFRWRWFYYIRQYDNVQLQYVLEAGLRSIPVADFIKAWSIISSMKTTYMQMTGDEAEQEMQRILSKFKKDNGEES